MSQSLIIFQTSTPTGHTPVRSTWYIRRAGVLFLKLRALRDKNYVNITCICTVKNKYFKTPVWCVVRVHSLTTQSYTPALQPTAVQALYYNAYTVLSGVASLYYFWSTNVPNYTHTHTHTHTHTIFSKSPYQNIHVCSAATRQWIIFNYSTNTHMFP